MQQWRHNEALMSKQEPTIWLMDARWFFWIEQKVSKQWIGVSSPLKWARSFSYNTPAEGRPSMMGLGM